MGEGNAVSGGGSGRPTDTAKTERPGRRKTNALITAILVGVATIACSASLEACSTANAPWKNALFVPDGEAPWDDVATVSVRRLPDRSVWGLILALANQQSGAATLPELLRAAEDRKAEYVVSISRPVDDLDPLLVSGRLPTPGQPEALAGDLAPRETFSLDGRAFTVVGRLHRSVSVFGFAYVMPNHADLERHFTDASGATTGWVDPRGLERLRRQEVSAEALRDVTVVTGMTRAHPAVIMATMLGLALVVVGGVLLELRILRRLAGRGFGILTPAFTAITARPRLLALVHGILYGALFAFMALGALNPVANMRFVDYLTVAFTEGELSYIGAAYESGSVPLAALATFAHNYLVATVLFTVLPSLIIPFAGLVKNLVTFVAVGFLTAPVWSESIGRLTYHSITMALELEAYVIASFFVVFLPVRVLEGFLDGAVWGRTKSALAALGGGTILAGIMLAAAALYEAATLILLG